MNKFIILLAAVPLLTFFSFRASFKIVKVIGSSMSPTLINGDRVLIFSWWPSKLIKKGQIVVASLPRSHLNPRLNVFFIKRVVGLPGEQQKTHLLEIHERIRQGHINQYDGQGYRTWHIPPKHCFLMGDSKGDDSRVWGPVAFESLKGLVFLRLPNLDKPEPKRGLSVMVRG